MLEGIRQGKVRKKEEEEGNLKMKVKIRWNVKNVKVSKGKEGTKEAK